MQAAIEAAAAQPYFVCGICGASFPGLIPTLGEAIRLLGDCPASATAKWPKTGQHGWFEQHNISAIEAWRKRQSVAAARR